jgi:oligoendopeptidase F
MKYTNSTWDFSELYKSDNDPQFDIDILNIEKQIDLFISKWKKRKDYLKDPVILAEAFKELESIAPTDSYFLKPLIYAYLRKSQDEESPIIKSLFTKVYDKEVEVMNKMSFFTQNIVKKIPKKLQPLYLKEPSLKEHWHSLSRAFENSKHLLSENEEKIFLLLAKPSSGNWTDMISQFVSKSSAKYKGEELGFEKILKMISERDKVKRDWAGKTVGKILSKIVDTAEFEINSFVTSYNISNELHKYKTFDESKHLHDDIDSNTVRAMISVVTENFKTSHRYSKLYAKLLGSETIKYHERAVEFSVEENKKYSFEDSMQIVKDTFKKLDPEFEQLVEKLHSENRYDVYPKKGKTGGAFCLSIHTLPTYILLNHAEKSNDVLTIAHESGHAIHGMLSQKKQHPNNSSSSTATAEVASTFFEDYTLEEMSKESDKLTKFYTLQKKLFDDISSIFRQVACYNFELDLHTTIKQKGFLNKTEIGEMFKKHMSAYLGEAVEFDEDHKLWWLYWPHIRLPFYVYSYASGLLISKSLQNKVKENPEFISKVKEFLSAGSHKSTFEIFSDLGIDISKKEFWESGINQINTMMDEFEKLGKELKIF